MKSIQVIIGTILVLLILSISCTTSEKQQSESRVIRHVVLFKFKDSTNQLAIEKINDAFIALENEIDVIKDFEWGLNHSPENLNQGFTHCYVVTFNSEKDRDSIYLPHPNHQDFVKKLQPILDKVLVVDYWVN